MNKTITRALILVLGLISLLSIGYICLSEENNIITKTEYIYKRDTVDTYIRGRDSLIYITKNQVIEKPIPHIIYLDTLHKDSTVCDSIREYNITSQSDTVQIYHYLKAKGILLESQLEYRLALPYRVDTLNRVINNYIDKTKKNNLYIAGSFPLGIGVIYTRDRFLCGYNYQIPNPQQPFNNPHNVIIGYRLFSK